MTDKSNDEDKATVFSFKVGSFGTWAVFAVEFWAYYGTETQLIILAAIFYQAKASKDIQHTPTGEL